MNLISVFQNPFTSRLERIPTGRRFHIEDSHIFLPTHQGQSVLSDYIVNKKSKKFHFPDCYSVSTIQNATELACIYREKEKFLKIICKVLSVSMRIKDEVIIFCIDGYTDNEFEEIIENRKES